MRRVDRAVFRYGLFSSFMGLFVYCVLGTSKDVSIGPTAIVSLIVAIEAKVRAPQQCDSLRGADGRFSQSMALCQHGTGGPGSCHCSSALVWVDPGGGRPPEVRRGV